MRRIAGIAVLLLASSHAIAAADYSLICQNPAHDYLVTFSDGDKVAVVDPDSAATEHPVLATIRTDAEHIIVLGTPDPTVTELLHLRPFQKIDVYGGGELVQTDACHF